MKRSIITTVCFIAVICAFLSLSGCSKDNADSGVLTINALSPDGDIHVEVYPYLVDYSNLDPVEEAVMNKKKTMVSFDLNAGNYMVSCKYGFSTKQSLGVQIRPGEKVNLELRERGFVKK